MMGYKMVAKKRGLTKSEYYITEVLWLEQYIGKEYTKPQLRAIIRGLEKEIKELQQQNWQYRKDNK